MSSVCFVCAFIVVVVVVVVVVILFSLLFVCPCQIEREEQLPH